MEFLAPSATVASDELGVFQNASFHFLLEIVPGCSACQRERYIKRIQEKSVAVFP